MLSSHTSLEPGDAEAVGRAPSASLLGAGEAQSNRVAISVISRNVSLEFLSFAFSIMISSTLFKSRKLLLL